MAPQIPAPPQIRLAPQDRSALDWSGLGEVTLVSIGATVGVVFVFALGVRILTRRDESGARPRLGGGRRRPSAPARVVAGLCFLTCAAAVAYGLYLIVPQFH
ncbi:hypothetical protein [Streptomyces lushanensis]|uniref:hypothetical protein n=1 Tax=Streptomyces lushanensis TaxID=1434255 RepID=UPI0008363D92|nr:hypothetical protein [Streptomyces lushanensis]